MTAERLLAEERSIKVSALERGTVIDHLRHGTGLRVLAVLGLSDADQTVSIGLNLDSRRMGRKDLIKIEGKELTREEIDKIAILSPEATLSIIRDFQVVSKLGPELENELEGVVRCRNPSCISNHERIPSRFLVADREPILRLRCAYCERVVPQGEIDLL